MSSHDLVVIIAIIAAFASFGAALGGTAWYSSHGKARAP